MAAESSNSSSKGFAKVFQKKVLRSKEKVLHSLGKADRTHDEVFDEHVSNFSRQQTAASKLQKELKNYINCVKTMQHASNNFYNAIKENYEDEWTGYTEIVSAIEQLSFLWEDYAQRLQSEVMDPMSIYLARFPEMRSKISKRGRKLVDFDSSRHNLQALEQTKKRDEGKIAKANDDLSESEHIYNAINTELHNDLPALHDSRINFLASNFTSFFTVESKFQEESAKVKTSMSTTSDDLQRESHIGMFDTPKPAKMLRNGDLEEDNVVDLSRNELSPMSSKSGGHITSTPGHDSSPTDYRNSNTRRRSNTKNSDSGSQSSASGQNTPVPKSRDSVHMYHNDPPPEDATNTQNQVNTTVPPSGEEAAYEDYSYDDGSYEAIAVRKQPEAAATPENTEPTVTESTHGKDSNDNMKQSNSLQEKEVDNNVNANDEDDDEEQVYKIPTSNEPVNDNIPFGVNVLYKDFTNQDVSSYPVSSSHMDNQTDPVANERKTSPTENITSVQSYDVPTNNKVFDWQQQPNPPVINQSNHMPHSNQNLNKSNETEKWSDALGSDIGDNLSIGVPPTPTPSPAHWGEAFQENIQTPSPKQWESSSDRSTPMNLEVDSRVTSFNNASSPAENLKNPTSSNTSKSRKFLSESSPVVDPVNTQSKHISMPGSFGDFDPEVDPFSDNVDHSKTFSTSNDHSFKSHDPFAGEDPFANEAPSPLTVPLDFNNASHKDFFKSFDNSTPSKNSIDPFAPLSSNSNTKTSPTFGSFNSGNGFDDNFNVKENIAALSSSGTVNDPFSQNTSFEANFGGDVSDNIKPPASFDDDLFDSVKSSEPVSNVDITVTGLDSSLSSEIMEILKTGNKINDENSGKPSDKVVSVNELGSENTLIDNSDTPQLEPVSTQGNPNLLPKSAHEVLPIPSQKNPLSNSESKHGETPPAYMSSHGAPISNMVSQHDDNLTTHIPLHGSPKHHTVPEQKENVADHSVNTTNGTGTNNGGPNILYRVQATHAYQGEDTDELTFESGEVICVTPWDDPEDQDDGWLYGIKESDGEKGVFPANFTKKL